MPKKCPARLTGPLLSGITNWTYSGLDQKGGTMATEHLSPRFQDLDTLAEPRRPLGAL